MGHLVEPLQDMSIQDCRRALEQAHQFLARCVNKEWFSQFQSAMNNSDCWGCQLKRIAINLPEGSEKRTFRDSTGTEHLLIGKEVENQKLAEIINQAANIERLIDALRWAQEDSSGLSNYRVYVCHPTTSSGRNDEAKAANDHDLVLIGPNGELAKFEVSDVASLRDGNRKEEKDLIRLGVLTAGEGEDKFKVSFWPSGRVFLVVSSDWIRRIADRKRRWVQKRTHEGVMIPPHIEFERKKIKSPTGIFEIKKGPGFGKSPLC